MAQLTIDRQQVGSRAIIAACGFLRVHGLREQGHGDSAKFGYDTKHGAFLRFLSFINMFNHRYLYTPKHPEIAELMKAVKDIFDKRVDPDSTYDSEANEKMGAFVEEWLAEREYNPDEDKDELNALDDESASFAELAGKGESKCW